MGKIEQSLKNNVRFNIKNTGTEAKKVCLFPGHYDTQKVEFVQDGSKAVTKVDIVETNPANLVAAGYNVDQVADDYVASLSKEPVHVSPNSNRCKFRDLRNYAKTKGFYIGRITIQNNATSQAIFNQEIEYGRTAPGCDPDRQFINLRKYLSINQYDKTRIDIDLVAENKAIEVNRDTYMAINVPGNADFDIEFEFA